MVTFEHHHFNDDTFDLIKGKLKHISGNVLFIDTNEDYIAIAVPDEFKPKLKQLIKEHRASFIVAQDGVIEEVR